MELYSIPSPNHILSILEQWECEKPLHISGQLVQALGGDVSWTERQTCRQEGRKVDRQYMNYSKTSYRYYEPVANFNFD